MIEIYLYILNQMFRIQRGHPHEYPYSKVVLNFYTSNPNYSDKARNKNYFGKFYFKGT